MRQWSLIIFMALLTLPGVTMELGLFHPSSPPVRALTEGIAIIGAAFLLSWAAEALQVDVSQGLALGLLALIAVLPEYIVDATFAWRAANEPEYAHYAVANMTGANRLLIGVAWPMVVFIGWIRFRRTHVTLDRGHGLELVVLLVASIYAIWIPFREEISLIDMVVLAVIFAFYIWRLAKLPAEDPHLIGPAATIAALPTNLRRIVTAALAIAAAIAIIFVAHPFSDDLVHTGTQWGIDEFLLVQWVAPLASEAPEFVVVALFAFRGATTAAMGTLVSSKINQWTLLVGMLPLIYSISLGEASGLPLDNLQQDELFLTAAQTLCAVMFMLSLRLSGFAAITLFTLFVGQFFFRHHLIEFSVIYLVLGVASVIYRREGVRDTLRDVRVAFRDTS